MTATLRDRHDRSDDLAKQHYTWSEAAEAEGFEPPDGFPPLAFKASALDRSATLPIVHASGWP